MYLYDYVEELRDLYQSEDYEGTIAKCTELLELDTESATAYYFKGLAQLNLGFFKQAIRAFDEALVRSPKCARILQMRAEAHLLSGDGCRAVADLTQAIKLEPKNGSLYLRRGEARELLGDYPGYDYYQSKHMPCED